MSGGKFGVLWCNGTRYCYEKIETICWTKKCCANGKNKLLGEKGDREKQKYRTLLSIIVREL
jgi:hypothetical protein